MSGARSDGSGCFRGAERNESADGSVCCVSDRETLAQTPVTPEPESPACDEPRPGPLTGPADSFLRRLSSLFNFNRSEPACSTLILNQNQSQCMAAPRPEEDEADAAEERERLEKRLHDLSCPPVVTYGTYRGLRRSKKQRDSGPQLNQNGTVNHPVTSPESDNPPPASQPSQSPEDSGTAPDLKDEGQNFCHTDGSRSTPSSGYESISGSDSDIRCGVGVASEVKNAPIGSQDEDEILEGKICHASEDDDEGELDSDPDTGRPVLSDVDLKSRRRLMMSEVSPPTGGHEDCSSSTPPVELRVLPPDAQSEVRPSWCDPMDLQEEEASRNISDVLSTLFHQQHQLMDGGFSFISEEEENDLVFVNDIGPVLSPGARRVKSYPFSLSPIYEEELGLNEVETEEEQKELPAASVLSLLQSVSEKLQSGLIQNHRLSDSDLGSVEGDSDCDQGSECEKHEATSCGTLRTGPSVECLRVTNPLDPKECLRVTNPLDPKECLRVTNPQDPKVQLFQGCGFSGWCRELLDHSPSEELGSIQSLRVTAGVWVGFSSEGFRGHQLLLQEGEYSDCSRLFSNTHTCIRSLRYIHTDFLEPSLSLNLSGRSITLDQDEPDLQESGSEGLCVESGTWVAYSGVGFSGQQCVLEKGRHAALLDWGETRSPPRSLRPIHMAVCPVSQPQFQLRVYAHTHFGGESREFMSDTPDFSFPELRSLRVIRGCWHLFDGESFSGHQFVVSEGHYPDLVSCGCPLTRIRSLKPIAHSFTDPSLSLFSLSGFQGLEETFCSAQENVSRFFSLSLRVRGGLWVLFEYGGFKGQQMLLRPGEYPDWWDHSGWETVGSLKPLRPPRRLLRLRSRALSSVLTAHTHGETPSLPAALHLTPADNTTHLPSQHTQHWIFSGGLLKNTGVRGCLTVIGSRAREGAPVALWEEHGHQNQRWSFNQDGSISSALDPGLVLDVSSALVHSSSSGGHQLVLTPADKATQRWDVDVL